VLTGWNTNNEQNSGHVDVSACSLQAYVALICTVRSTFTLYSQRNGRSQRWQHHNDFAHAHLCLSSTVLLFVCLCY